MGKIRLTGATSGYTEIQAASAAGNNTITLPTTNGGQVIVSDSSGNVNIDSGTFYVDASNNRVGIGTTSPNTTLEVSRASNNLGITEVLRIGGTAATTGDGYKLTFYQTAIGEYGYVGSYYTGGVNWNTVVNGSAGLEFRINNSERARITSDGKLLVGTSTGPSDTTVLFSGNAGDGSTGDGRLHLNRGSTPGNGVQLGALYFSSNNGANQGASVVAVRDGGTWTAGSSHPTLLKFSTTADGASSPTERMRIDNAGGSAFFASSVTAVAARNAAAAGTSTYNIAGLHSATSTTNGTLSFAVYTNGNVQNTNNSYGSLSDAKLKENIVDATSQWSDIKALQVRKYNFKEETGQETHTQIGLIAQEAELVSPGLVSESPDRDEDGNDLGTVTKSVNYSVLYMKAVKALQEAMERIETLEAKVAALEGV
jgi:hypothetical protein